MKRDELNVLAENYYSVMDIDEEQKKKREEDAWDLFELFMLLFYYFEEAQNNEVEDQSFILPRFQIDLQEVVSNITEVDDYLIDYFTVLALGVYSTTLAHLSEKYYLSDDRAANLALNESNTINNYLDVKEAKEEGYTHKKWVAELDERTRLEHIMMDGTIVPIDGYFEFSDCKMFAPHDVVNGTPAQNANCRCSLSYLTLENSITDAIIEEPKDPDSCNVFKLYKLFATPEQTDALAARYRAGGMGWGHAKAELQNVLEEQLGPAREKYFHLLNHTEEIDKILA